MKIKGDSLFRYTIILLLCSALLTACSNGDTPINTADTDGTTVNADASSPEHNSQQDKDIMLQGNIANEERNRLFREDILYFAKEFPQKHKYPFTYLSKEDFNRKLEELADRVDQLQNHQIYVELNKIIAEIKDGHTSINYWDGYSYPLRFYLFEEGVYVVNADHSLSEALNARVTAINGVPIDEVLNKLTELVSYENESWLKARLPDYLVSPVYMYGLGVIDNEQSTLFTLEKEGEQQEVLIPILEYGEKADWINTATKDSFTGLYEQNYDYRYIPDSETLYFEYNACAEQVGLKFSDFNKQMFQEIEEQAPKRLILDLRSNGGGDSEILNPFTKKLKKYVAKHPDMQLFILIGRNTFSSGMFAIYRTLEAAPDAINVGEPAGGAIDCYGDVRMFQLPHSQLPIGYSTKYFQFSTSFSYKNRGEGVFLPDVELATAFENYLKGNDEVLNYALSH